MTYAAFFLSSLIPAIMLWAAWQFARRKSAAAQWIFVSVGLLLSLPVGIFCVAISVGITYDARYEHSPGIGVAFIPFVVVWCLCVVGTYTRLIAMFIISLFQRFSDRKRSTGPK